MPLAGSSAEQDADRVARLPGGSQSSTVSSANFNVKRRGKITYYTSAGEDRPVLAALVTEEQADGDLRIYLSGLTGGHSAQGVLGLDELVTMQPAKEVPLVFECWAEWLRRAGVAQSLAEIDFIEVHAFGAQPKAPSPLTDPTGYRTEQLRLRSEYSEAYSTYFAEQLPDHGVPARFTVHVVDFPDEAASYEFYSVALLQRGLTKTASKL